MIPSDISTKYKLILASGSPRRQQFLRDMGFDFEIQLKNVAETYPTELKAQQITDYLALLKANVFKLNPNEILISSDTIVWLDGQAIGKPKDFTDAFDCLRRLSGKTHEVITSVCLKSTLKTHVFHEITRVSFGVLSDEEIRFYLKQYQPFDKAGAYGIQEWIGLIGITRIDGSYTNVVGLPTEKFYKELLCFIS